MISRTQSGKRSMRSIGGLVGLLLLAVIASPPVAAQDSQDVRSLLDRLQRMERDLVTLQQQVYRGRPAPAGGTAAPDSDPTVAAALQVRITQLQDEMRTTTGQLEEVNFNVGDLRQRLDRLVNDVDFRLTELEKAFAQPAGAAPAAEAAAPAKPAAPGAIPAAAAGSRPVKLPAGTPKEQYEFAFDLLKRSDYGQAEQALKQFVAAHPNDPLASNAQYWLGETFYARKDYANAAAQFLQGYQKYPQSAKGPDSLYKLGASLAGLGKSVEACAAYARFQKEYPAASGSLKGRVTEERQTLKCK